MDQLFDFLSKSQVGCHIGEMFMGDADDVIIIVAHCWCGLFFFLART